MARKAKTKQSRSSDPIVDHVCDFMHSNCRAMSIDALLARPLDALKMGVFVGAKAGKISERDAKKLFLTFEELVSLYPTAMEVVDEVCRKAINARKHGDLKRDRY